MIDTLKNLPTTALSDALKGKNHLPSTIKPIVDTYKVCGRAVTVQLPIYENGAVMEGMLKCEPGDVLVVDIDNDTTRAVAGDFVISMMQQLQLGGLVVNGAIRDIEAVKALQFPVFVTGITPAAGVKNGGGQVNIPIHIGKTTIHPGDLVVGDRDGVVIIPQNATAEVIEKALQKIEKDAEREKQVLQSKETIIAHLTKVTNALV